MTSSDNSHRDSFYKRHRDKIWIGVICSFLATCFLELLSSIVKLFLSKDDYLFIYVDSWDLVFSAVNLLVFIALTVLFSSILYRKNFVEFLKQKLKETFELFLEHDDRHDLPLETQYNCFNMGLAYKEIKKNKNDSYKALVKLLHEFICYNQGQIAQFYYSAGELHKPIKEETKLGSNANIEKLRDICEAINTKLPDKIENIFEKNNKFISRFFESRSSVQPRWCIKGINNDLIEDIFRYEGEYSSPAVKPSENTGFDKVLENGKYYICNNIPGDVIEERYINPRLDGEKVREKKRRGIDIFQPNEWMDCWYINRDENGNTKENSPSSCYMSTLIIPITFLRNELSDEFREHFEIPKVRKKGELSRAILGMLCFDHIGTNFFIEEIDKYFGYMVADIFSLYLIAHLMYTDYSKSFDRANEIIEGNLHRLEA